MDRAWFRGLDELHQFLNPYECTDTYKQPYPVPAITSSRGDGRGHERQRVTQRKMTNRGKTKETDRGNVRSQEKCRFKSSMGGIHGAERLDTPDRRKSPYLSTDRAFAAGATRENAFPKKLGWDRPR